MARGKESNKVEAVVIAGAVPMVAGMGLKITGLVPDAAATTIIIVGLFFEVLDLIGLAYCRFRTPETAAAAGVSVGYSRTPGFGDGISRAELLGIAEAISGDVERLQENVNQLERWIENRS